MKHLTCDVEAGIRHRGPGTYRLIQDSLQGRFHVRRHIQGPYMPALGPYIWQSSKHRGCAATTGDNSPSAGPPTSLPQVTPCSSQCSRETAQIRACCGTMRPAAMHMRSQCKGAQNAGSMSSTLCCVPLRCPGFAAGRMNRRVLTVSEQRARDVSLCPTAVMHCMFCGVRVLKRPEGVERSSRGEPPVPSSE